jgi:hypothetical protein
MTSIGIGRPRSTRSELQMNIMSFFAAAGSRTLKSYLKMDIIDALAVNGPLKVAYWAEAKDDADMPAHGEYYWQQTYNHDTKALSVSISSSMLKFGNCTDSWSL